jgi:hypothetical protein
MAFPLAACTVGPRWQGAGAAEWPTFHQALEAERMAQPHAPWSAQVRAVVHVPGRTYAGRGGLAASPGHAVRMILVGGPGATLLDIWITRDRWRIAIPPLDRVLRGGIDEPPDLPVGFLRWWFCRPLEGTLYAAAPASPEGTWFLLRDGDATVELHDAPHRLEAHRKAHGRTQTVTEARQGPLPHPGDAVRYEDGGGLSIDILVESLGDAAPSPDAFVDPDHAPAGDGDVPSP